LKIKFEATANLILCQDCCILDILEKYLTTEIVRSVGHLVSWLKYLTWNSSLLWST